MNLQQWFDIHDAGTLIQMAQNREDDHQPLLGRGTQRRSELQNTALSTYNQLIQISKVNLTEEKKCFNIFVYLI